MSFEDKPESFLKVIFHNPACVNAPGKTFSCSDYENGKWRAKDFGEYLIEWLPEFALKFSEYTNFNGATGKRLLRKAAYHVYTTIKKENRGEFGEILLHALIREIFNSKPAVSKVFYKTSANDTVKGFDAVHLVEFDNDYEIWLGEAKVVNDEIVFPDEEYWDNTPLEYCNCDYDALKETFSEELITLDIIGTADLKGYEYAQKYVNAHLMSYLLGCDWSTEDIDDEDVLLHPRADRNIVE